MSPSPPENPKIYHITHIDNLASIVEKGLLCDSEAPLQKQSIAYEEVKQRRNWTSLKSYSGSLKVIDCVPFYFCSRSVMLYVIHKNYGAEIDGFYSGGQEPIIHLCTDIKKAIEWADEHKTRWAFTDANAATNNFDDYKSLNDLDKLNWDAIYAKDWSEGNIKDGKQAEFLIESHFPFGLFDEIGVYSNDIYNRVTEAIGHLQHKPSVSIKKDWYYWK